MRQIRGLQLSVVVVMAALLGGLGMAVAQDGPQLASGAPTVVSYQGQVQVGGIPYTGMGRMKFAIVDEAGTTTFWSNDGTSSGGSEPAEGVPLAVSGGLVNVLLGDTSLVHMTALPASAFAGPERRLRVWFSDGGASTLLSPDRRIAAVPYALQAQEAANAATLDGLASSAYQQRVSAACAAGSTIRAVNVDGSVVCELDAPLRRSGPPDANGVTAPDTAGDVGRHTAITVGADGVPVVSYYDATNADLKVLHCGNADCTAGNLSTTVDATGSAGENSSIIIGADSLPLITYYDAGNAHLKVLHCGNAACTAGNTVTAADPSGNVGQFTSMAIGVDGLAVISYFENWNSDLKVLHCGNAACTSGNVSTTVDAAGNVGLYTSIAIGGDSLPIVSYWDLTNGNLKVLHCGNSVCTSGNVSTTVDAPGTVGQFTSLAIGADGLPVISYYDGTNVNLKVVHCGNRACTSGNTISTADTTSYVGNFSAITIGADDLPLVSYYDNANGDLRVLHCGNAACSAGNTVTAVDPAGMVGGYTAITIGVDGLPVVSYYDESNGDLKVAHCANAFCIPYWRRR